MAGVQLVVEDELPSLTGQLRSVYVITYTLPNPQGEEVPYSVTVDKNPQAVEAARAAIDQLVAQVSALYGL
jgi:hypothetical protein